MSEHEFESMRDLGKRYGVSSHRVGRLLTTEGLRTGNGRPSSKAFDLGMVKTASTGRGDDNGYFYVWHVGKTTELLNGLLRQRANGTTK